MDRHRQLLLVYSIDLPWIHQAEKEWPIKVLVAFAVLTTLLGIVILLHHLTALSRKESRT